MQPPKCRTCGAEEWAHKCARTPAPKKPKMKRNRRKYQRELMRKRRAKLATATAEVGG